MEFHVIYREYHGNSHGNPMENVVSLLSKNDDIKGEKHEKSSPLTTKNIANMGG